MTEKAPTCLVFSHIDAYTIVLAPVALDNRISVKHERRASLADVQMSDTGSIKSVVERTDCH